VLPLPPEFVAIKYNLQMAGAEVACLAACAAEVFSCGDTVFLLTATLIQKYVEKPSSWNIERKTRYELDVCTSLIPGGHACMEGHSGL
jgi:hypothetical protein